MGYRLDEIDRRIIYALMRDARNTSAPTMAEQVNVSPATIRNRLGQLEKQGIIRGYTAEIDFEQAEDRLTHLFLGTAPIPERKALRQEVQALPGVINVRELMTGRKNLHIKAVGEQTGDLTQLAQAISELGIDIEEEILFESETSVAYDPFGPDEEMPASDPTDVISLPGDAQVVDVTVQADAPIVDHTLEEAVQEGLLDGDDLIIAIERGDRMVTPTGTTNVRPDDIVTGLSRGGDTDRILDPFITGEVPTQR